MFPCHPGSDPEHSTRRVLALSAPIGLAFIPLGMALGFLVVHAGLSWWWAPVFAAVCEHLGADLGYGGTVKGEVLQCPFHGWQWNRQGRNVCIPYEDRPNRGRRIKTYPVVERNESVYIWHDIENRDSFFEAPDIFADFGDDSSAADYYPQQRLFRRSSGCSGRAWRCTRSTSWRTAWTSRFKYVHNTPIVPVFTRHDFDDPVSYVDFTITFEGDDGQKIEDVNSGVEPSTADSASR